MKINKKTEADELKNQLARALADYDNLRKRVEREKEDLEKISGLRFIIRLLPILDALRYAQVHLKDQGLAITIAEFENFLKDEGVEEIPVKVGDFYNPKDEEVIETVESKSEEDNNKVAEIVLSGWRLNGELSHEEFVIRPVKVKVYKIKENK